ncbi:acyl-CoA dehydrogenase family protein [Chryseosolibacter indicus]|uniref:Acyl-CoA dehydrogenase family protein n=1 Tax=Chryseosolibacter indicus TaxID=2782351 RepID=A0ABS5VW30_9BACT|nr:acyl-CoA dehydrogenase [Chryseosolibacter indicus]MBT1705035.1 acyl-CoA dehydrogenase family protein [Chryseosolibacter indicus]
MINSKPLKENPNLFVFLPIYYLVWSDTLLTNEEVDLLKDLLSKQSWLKENEKTFLLDHLDPSNPPSTDDLKLWLEEIRKVLNKDQATSETLADIGIRLVNLHQDNHTANNVIQVRDNIHAIEERLGLISKESLYQFMPESRKTIMQQRKTQQNFNIDTLAKILDGEHTDIINQVKSVLSDPSFKYIETDSLSEYREKVLQWCQQLAKQGFGAMGYPTAYGGKDDMARYFTVMETLSYHDLSLVIKFGVQFGLFGMSIYFLGTEKHHKKYLHDVGTLQLPGCFAMTETGHGSNVKGIETTATYNHSKRSFIIHTPNSQAQKEYIGNAALHGKMATVFAKLVIDGKDYGVNAFLVPLRDANEKTLPGVTIEDCGRKMGLNGVDNGKIIFNEVEIPHENMLDRFASVTEDGKFHSPITSDNRRFFTMLGTLVGGRIGIPRSGLSATKSGLTIAIRYGDQRKQFGPEGGAEVPILNYRSHQRRLMPLLANAYALHFALQYLTNRFLTRTDDDIQEIEALAAGLKSFATWNTTQSLQECREACGGKGYLSENRIDRLKNDTEIYTTFEGDNTVLMQLVAKSRLSEFKQEFSNMDLFGMLNYLAGQAKTSFSEMNPLIVRKTDEEHLLDPEFHLNAFKYRERHILTSAAKRLKRHIDSGMDSFDAFNVTQHHLIAVGFAYIERIILEQFQLQVEKTEDEGCKRILKKLCQLFALSQIDRNKGWYLENDYMTGAKTKAIRKTLNQLCWDIRQDAVPLVNAFKIPDVLLSAPIAVKG